MFKLLNDLLKILTYRQKRELFFLQVMVVFTAILEVLSIAAIGPFMTLVGNLSLIEQNKFIQRVYISFGSVQPSNFLVALGIIVLGLLFFSSIISIITIWKLSIFAAKVGADFGDVLYEYYIKKDYLYHTETSSSILTKQIATEVSRVTDNVLQPVVQINARIVTVILIAVSIFAYNAIISIVGLITLIAIYYLLYLFVRNKLDRNGKIISEYSKRRFSLMNEGFAAVKVIQVLGRESSFIQEFKASGQAFAKSYGSSNGLYNMPKYVMEFVVYGGMISLILLLIDIYQGDLSEVLPVMAVFGVAAFKLLPSFQQIYSGTAQIRSNLSAFDAIKSDLYAARKNKEISPGKNVKPNLSGDIVLTDVDFSYEGKEDKVLKQINITIPYKKSIGIVGASGAGKSTLLDLFLGVIQPASGTIKIGEELLNRTNIRQWQNNIGYVPQSIFLKEGSIAENIAFGIPKKAIDIKKINKAIEISHLKRWVEHLPNGMYAEVGERGVQISGGQRQRIGISRALYDDAEFLFFDEATSALDGITENDIMDAIAEISGRKTIVMIAHRINTIKNFDYIYMLENGRVVAEGNYNYLFSNNTQFKKMAEGKKLK